MTTTIDLGLQDIARAAIKKILPSPDGPAAALVAIDPRDGSVKAMFGGTNFRKSQFNLATQAERQPGSSFKPIVLATALHEGLSPLTSFDSKPVTIFTGDRYWHVTNYESDYRGHSNLADGMVHSDNAVYAQLTQLVKPKNIVTMAHALGIRSHLDPFFSIGLGGLAVNPLDMARAYATIANDGHRVDSSIFGDRPRVVIQVKDVRSGNTRGNMPVAHAALTTPEAETLTSILQRVVTSGTGIRAALPDRPVAGKTGTTDNYGDAWFVGYTPQSGGRCLGRLPQRAQADAHRVRRQAGRRRHAPCRDLEGVHDQCASRARRHATDLRASAVPRLQRAPRRLSQGSVAARQRLLQGDAARRLLHRSRPRGRHGGLQAERGRGAKRRRSLGRGRDRAARTATARRPSRLCPRKSRQAAGRRDPPVPGRTAASPPTTP